LQSLEPISDTGSGIPPEIVHRIFEPFFSTKEVGKGSGLGLSMIYGFMKQSKGHVNVYSEPGRGTTFRLYMPPAIGERASSPKAPVSAPEARGHGELVLAVDDVPALRHVIVRQITELGYRVMEADTAAAALAILEQHPVDVLYTDVIIAGGATGFDLASAAQARWPKLRVIFTSGFPDTKLGNGDGPKVTGKLLNKPVRKEDLAWALRETLHTQTA
jgi:CheY-like chemotaxis protein